MPLQGLLRVQLDISATINPRNPTQIQSVPSGTRIASISVLHMTAAGAAAGVSLHFGVSGQPFPLETFGAWVDLEDNQADEGLYFSVAAGAGGTENIVLGVSMVGPSGAAASLQS